MSPKQHAVLLIGAIIGALGVLGWLRGTAAPELLWMFGIGVVLAITYVVRGGSLPRWMAMYANVAEDDDPSNLSVPLYLTILAAVLLIAGILLYFGMRR
jgi:hypothetical protein